jgi:hypothetical protein
MRDEGRWFAEYFDAIFTGKSLHRLKPIMDVAKWVMLVWISKLARKALSVSPPSIFKHLALAHQMTQKVAQRQGEHESQTCLVDAPSRHKKLHHLIENHYHDSILDED